MSFLDGLLMGIAHVYREYEKEIDTKMEVTAVDDIVFVSFDVTIYCC